MTADALRRDVLEALDLHPGIRAAAIGVAVEDDGVVTLSGHVETYFEKEAAGEIVKDVPGVHALANDLHVRVSEATERDDTDLAMAARHALEWNNAVPADRIRVLVEHGRVTLEGEVDWRYQRETAERAVAFLVGVRAIDNRITLPSRADPADLGARSPFER